MKFLDVVCFLVIRIQSANQSEVCKASNSSKSSAKKIHFRKNRINRNFTIKRRQKAKTMSHFGRILPLNFVCIYKNYVRLNANIDENLSRIDFVLLVLPHYLNTIIPSLSSIRDLGVFTSDHSTSSLNTVSK